MSMLLVVVLSAFVLTVAYWTYGPVLSRLLKLDPHAKTPAVELRDDVDYVPIAPKLLLGQHFSAIAAAGPIVGPILAGVMFGWLPALIWILVGSIFIGGVHDMTALVASIRHRADSIATVVRDHMSRRSYFLFLSFVWLALVYIVVAFTDVTAASFVGALKLENGDVVSGPGIASSSLIYLALPIIMGLLMRYARMSITVATLVFLPLVGVAIWIGQLIPLDIAAIFGVNDARAQTIWSMLLLLYCFFASLVPMWLLLQPRGHLGGYFLYAALIGGALGLMFGNKPIQFPAFQGWTSERGEPLFPILFITIACGACSGFHSLIASGTTSKQLRYETDARIIGYGSMLMEAMVAIVSLCCVMMLLPQDAKDVKPNFLYARGIGSFLEVLGLPVNLGIAFGLMAFTTFVYDTLDICTRLGRYIIQELTGWHNAAGRALATGLTAGVPLILLLQQASAAVGPGPHKPAWLTFWELFGASNQLLAALTLIGVTVWLWRTRRARWVWIVTGIPTVWMYVMSTWALGRIINRDLVTYYQTHGQMTANPVPYVAILLVGLAVMMLLEAAIVINSPSRNLAPAQPA